LLCGAAGLAPRSQGHQTGQHFIYHPTLEQSLSTPRRS
jgi:hypothetical protein